MLSVPYAEFMLNVTCKRYILSVVMLNVVMLNVVAPKVRYSPPRQDI